MKRLYPTVILLFLGLSIVANDKTTQDTTVTEIIIDVDVVSISEPQISKEEIPERIITLSNEKSSLCHRLGNYRKALQWKRKKDLILTTTGYFKPSITHGLTDLKSASDGFCKKVEDEIVFILAYYDLEHSISSLYVDQLVEMRRQVETEYDKMPSLLSRKLR